MRRLVMVSALVSGLLAMGSSAAYAQVKTFMLIPGIPGSAIDAGHKDWIEVLSMSQGASAVKKSVACSDVSIMKVLDQAGPMLWAAAAGRQLFPEVRIEVVISSPTPHVLYDIRLNNARVTSTQTSSSGQYPTESVSFSYDSVTLTFNVQDNRTGAWTPGTPETIGCQ